MADWPAQLKPLIYTLQESPPNNVIASSMDRGPNKIRRRTTANIRPITFNSFMLKADVEIMDDFYVNETMSGSLTFNFTHPRTDVVHQARFTEPPSYKNKGKGYDVSVSLELLP